MKRPPGTSPPLVIMSSSSSPMQVQTSSAAQPVVMTTPRLRGVSPVLPQGAVLMQQPITTSLATQIQGTNPASQSTSKVTIIGNKGSSSLSQLSLLAQHPQGHASPGTTQIHIKPNTSGPTFTSAANAGATIQRQVLPVQTLPGNIL